MIKRQLKSYLAVSNPGLSQFMLSQRENVVLSATRLCHPLAFRERPLKLGGRRV
jgi:hypothetical protein